MRLPYLVLAVIAAVTLGTAPAVAQELRAEFNGRVVHLELAGSYPQYRIQRAEPGGEFVTLEYNQTGCTGRCTYDDYQALLDQSYLYRILVDMPTGEQLLFGPTPFALDPTVGLALNALSAPNPVQNFTEISWVVPSTIARLGEVRTVLTIHDPSGREVNRLWEQSVPVGNYSVEWNGQDRTGRALPNGSYFYRVQVGATTEVGRLVLLKN